MNRTRAMVLALISLSLSAVVALVSYRLLENRLNPTARMGRVVVATKRLGLGARILQEDVRAVAWPAGAPLEGGFADPKDVVGRGVLTTIVPNEPVLESKLASREAGVGMAAAIPDGMRAVAVKVNDVIGVAGFVLPGTRVDVILTGSPNEKNATDTSQMILENVQVLSAGTHLEPDSRGTPQDVPVVTLLVTPEDAQKLALASADGRIQLALRNPMDLEHRFPEALRKVALFNLPPPPPAAAPRARSNPGAKKVVVVPNDLTVELIQGSKRETWTFDEKEQEKKKEPE